MRSGKKYRNNSAIGRAIGFAEPLELRRLLSAGAHNFNRLGGELSRLYDDYRGKASEAVLAGKSVSDVRVTSHNPAMHLQGNYVAVDMVGTGSGTGLINDLKKLGAIDISRIKNAVGARIPIDRLSDLDVLPTLKFAQPSLWMLTTGSVASQADNAIRSVNARSTYGLTGAGVKVGVLSDSFNTSTTTTIHYANDVTSGDLPAGVTILADSAGGTDEGRAMAQLIYDEAPGVSLYFATANSTQVQFANNIKALRDAGCKVIVDDVAYFGEPFFQDGVVAQAVDNVTASGVTYFSAAGNQAKQSYDSVWRAGVVRASGSIPGSPSFLGGTSFDFDTSAAVDDMNSFTLANAKSVLFSLQWDQPFASAGGTACANEVDIYVLNAAGTTIVGGIRSTNLGGDASEVFQFTNSTGASATFNLMIVQRTSSGGPTPGRVKYIEYNATGSAYQFPMTVGTIVAHANSASGAGVAAARYDWTPFYGSNPPVAEYFTSYGQVPILFNTSGTLLGAPIQRNQPLITGVDGSDTTFFGQAYDATSAPNFFGTSAAAPTVAGVAALLLQKVPTATPAQVLNALATTALDITSALSGPSGATTGAAAGYDFLTGWGLVRADNAIATFAVDTITGNVWEDRNSNGINSGEPNLNAVTVYLDIDNSGTLNAGDISTTTNASGNYTFSSLFPGTYTQRAVAPANYILTSPAGGSYSTVLAIGGSATGKNFGYFPTLITFTAGADSIGVQSSGGTITQVTVSAVVTYSISTSLLPSLTIDTDGGNDAIAIDFGAGNPVPAGGLTLIAGTNTDTLDIRGTSASDPFTVPSVGLLTHGTANVNFSGFETYLLNLGTVTFNVDLNIPTLFVASTAKAKFGSNQTIGFLSLTASGAAAEILTNGNRVLTVTTLGIAAGAVLDIQNNDLIVATPSARSTIQSLIQTGQNGFDGNGQTLWNGSGIRSSAARTANTQPSLLLDLYTIGVIKNLDLDTVIGPGAHYTTFDGVDLTPFGNDVVLVKYTYAGDTDLNGTVTIDDYNAIDAAFSGNGPSNLGWINGDFDFNGTITIDDYNAIDSGYANQLGVI